MAESGNGWGLGGRFCRSGQPQDAVVVVYSDPMSGAVSAVVEAVLQIVWNF